jgi:hypothetical protein
MAKTGGQKWVKRCSLAYGRGLYMKRILLLLAAGTLCAATAAAQTAVPVQTGVSAQPQTAVQTNNSAAQSPANVSGMSSSTVSPSTATAATAGNNFASLPSGTKIDASLATSLDARWSRPGDDVEVRTEEDIKEDGKVVLKKGTHLVGHVTEAQMRAGKQTQSQLGIVFDRAVLKDGEEVPFSASIQALASAQPATPSGADDSMAAGGGIAAARGSARGDGLAGGASSTAGATTTASTSATAGALINTSTSIPLNAGGTPNAATRSSGAVGGLTAAGRLAPSSSGVFGLEGLSIDSASTMTAQGTTTIVSTTRNIHLDSGTQLLLRTTGQAQ